MFLSAADVDIIFIRLCVVTDGGSRPGLAALTEHAFVWLMSTPCTYVSPCVCVCARVCVCVPVCRSACHISYASRHSSLAWPPLHLHRHCLLPLPSRCRLSRHLFVAHPTTQCRQHVTCYTTSSCDMSGPVRWSVVNVSQDYIHVTSSVTSLQQQVCADLYLLPVSHVTGGRRRRKWRHGMLMLQQLQRRRLVISLWVDSRCFLHHLVNIQAYRVCQKTGLFWRAVGFLFVAIKTRKPSWR